MKRLPAFAWLVVVWVALWGEATPANLLGGAAVAAAVLRVFGRAGPRPAGPVRPLAALSFAGWFAVKLVQATVQVAVEAARPRPRINEAVIALPLPQVSDAVATVVANAISLTPGTLTLEVESDRDAAVLYVHALQAPDPDVTRRQLFDLARRARAAFGERMPSAVDEMAEA